MSGPSGTFSYILGVRLAQYLVVVIIFHIQENHTSEIYPCTMDVSMCSSRTIWKETTQQEVDLSFTRTISSPVKLPLIAYRRKSDRKIIILFHDRV